MRSWSWPNPTPLWFGTCFFLLLVISSVKSLRPQESEVRNRAASAARSRAGPSQSKAKLRATLTNASKWFNEGGLPHVFMFGTALGLHRDNDVIDGDDDVDVLVPCKHLESARDILESHGIRFLYREDWQINGTWHGPCFLRVDGFGKPAEWAPLDIYGDTGDNETVCETQDGVAWPRVLTHPPLVKHLRLDGHDYAFHVPSSMDAWFPFIYGSGILDHSGHGKGDSTLASDYFHAKQCQGSCDRNTSWYGIEDVITPDVGAVIVVVVFASLALLAVIRQGSFDFSKYHIVLLYITLSVADFAALRWVRTQHQRLPFDILCFLLLEELCKLVFQVVMVIRRGLLPELRSMTRGEIRCLFISAFCSVWSACAFMLAIDRLPFQSLSSSFALTLPFCSILWLWVEPKRLSWIRVFACSLVTSSAVLQSGSLDLGSIFGQSARLDFDFGVFEWWRVKQDAFEAAIPALCALLASISIVAAERVKRDVNIACSIYSFVGASLVLLTLALLEPRRLSYAFFEGMFKYDVQVLMILRIMVGVVTQEMLELAGATNTVAASSICGALTTVVAPWMLPVRLKYQTLASLILAFAGGMLYWADPTVKASSAMKKRSGSGRNARKHLMERADE
eukprot:TRINITY_DN24281_c0_g1_i1.p1 TRINITY_DN24281_c0_g1~~TRINITY_DN24281_c0_g1_i1.p1  ORF type:complete len:623 (+),score=82.19 TRINITY_DN24281_c0_g1_i1:93-1961(+)